MNPYDDVVKRLSAPIGCGWEGCEDVVHGRQPFPEEDNMQQWELYLTKHDRKENHPHRKLKEVPNVLIIDVDYPEYPE